MKINLTQVYFCISLFGLFLGCKQQSSPIGQEVLMAEASTEIPIEPDEVIEEEVVESIPSLNVETYLKKLERGRVLQGMRLGYQVESKGRAKQNFEYLGELV